MLDYYRLRKTKKARIKRAFKKYLVLVSVKLLKSLDEFIRIG
jgi:hypothetical protein